MSGISYNSVYNRRRFNYRRRQGGFHGKPRYVTHPMFRGIRLKPNFDVNSRVVSVDYFASLVAATDGTTATMLITGDGYYTSSAQALGAPMIFAYFPNARFDSAASGFKEYTIVGVKVTFVPHRVVTSAVNGL